MKSVVIGGTGLIGSKKRRESIKPGDPRLRIKRRPICRPTKGEGHYQELLRYAGRVATFLRLTTPRVFPSGCHERVKIFSPPTPAKVDSFISSISLVRTGDLRTKTRGWFAVRLMSVRRRH